MPFYQLRIGQLRTAFAFMVGYQLKIGQVRTAFIFRVGLYKVHTNIQYVKLVNMSYGIS